MHTKNNILANTLEQMLADADDHGRDGIQPMLNPKDVKAILHGLNLADKSACNAESCCGDTESRNPLPLMQREFLATIEGMTSPNYKERFRAEYIQTKVRYERLKAFNTKIEAASCSTVKVEKPKHDCPYEMLKAQQHAMAQYLHILELRAVIEGVEL